VLITLAACALPPAEGAPWLDGRMPVHLTTGSQAAGIYGTTEALEEFHCSFGLDPAYEPLFRGDGLRITGVGDEGEARVVELDGAGFFIGTLFMPQIAVAAGERHPLVDAFVLAAEAGATGR
jgi:CTP synthase (UTP-ammonia lyase)